MSAAMGFFSSGTQERVRKRHGKQAIRVRAIEVLLYSDHTVSLHVYFLSQPQGLPL